MVSRNLERANENDGFKMTALEYLFSTTGMPMSVHFIDPKQLLVGYEDGSVLQWNLETNQIMAEKKLHGEPGKCKECNAHHCRYHHVVYDNTGALISHHE